MAARVTVSMPVFNTPVHLVERAVASVLSQTMGDLRLVITNDGGSRYPAGTFPSDDRLVYWELPQNRGRYYVDSVVAWATDSPWFTAHDSDDWSEPERLTLLLLGVRHAQAVAGTCRWHYQDGRVREHVPTTDRVPRLGLHWHYSALYRTQLVRRLLHPHVRLGWDCGLSSMVHARFEYRVIPDPLYHWEQRPGSLTQDPFTKRGSPRRESDWRVIETAWGEFQAGRLSLPRPLDEDVESLRSLMGGAL